LSVISIQMRSQAISFNQLNEVEGVQNEQQRSQNWFLRHTAQQNDWLCAIPKSASVFAYPILLFNL